MDHTSVRSLELRFMTPMDEYWSPVFLWHTRMTGIREISFHFYFPVDHYFERVVSTLSSMVLSLRLPQLQTVAFVIWTAQTDSVEDYTADLELIRVLTEVRATSNLATTGQSFSEVRSTLYYCT